MISLSLCVCVCVWLRVCGCVRARACRALKAPCVFVSGGYLYRLNFFSSPSPRSTSATLKEISSSRKRRFSVGTKPARKMLMPCGAGAARDAAAAE